MEKLRFAKLREGAIIPSKRAEDAGYDIYPCFGEDYMLIRGHETVLVSTGIASVIPEGYYIQIEERGSTGSIGLKKSAGVIDSGYRGEWFIALCNATNHPIAIIKKDAPAEKKELLRNVMRYPYEKAIAQAVLHKIPEAEVIEISIAELERYDSIRGAGALGSSEK